MGLVEKKRKKKTLGPLPSEADGHMQRRPGLLKHTEKGAPLAILLHCLLSKSHNSGGGGRFVRRRASEMISTPDGHKHTVKGNPHPHMHTKTQNKLCCLTTIGTSSGGGSICPGGGGFRTRGKLKPLVAI